MNQNRGFDMDTISKPQHVIQELVNTGVVQAVKALPVPMQADGYHLFFYDKKGGKVAVLEAQRGDHRVFKTLDTVAVFVKKMGLDTFSVTVRT